MRYRPQIKARTSEERALAFLGVPSQYWGLQLKDFSFRSTKFWGGNLSAVAQRHWCESLLLDPPYAPLIVVASQPSDRASFGLVSWLLKHRLNLGKTFLADASSPFDYNRNPVTLCIHNVMNEATPARCEAVRDMLVAYDAAFRCVAVAGTKNPEGWSISKLRLRPSAVFYLKDLDH